MKMIFVFEIAKIFNKKETKQIGTQVPGPLQTIKSGRSVDTR
jgi:hypothetical protein